MKPPTILMVQVMPNIWQIQSQKGHILQKGIVACSVREAKDYVSKYASSFPDWTYDIVLLSTKSQTRG